MRANSRTIPGLHVEVLAYEEATGVRPESIEMSNMQCWKMENEYGERYCPMRFTHLSDERANRFEGIPIQIVRGNDDAD